VWFRAVPRGRTAHDPVLQTLAAADEEPDDLVPGGGTERTAEVRIGRSSRCVPLNVRRTCQSDGIIPVLPHAVAESFPTTSTGWRHALSRRSCACLASGGGQSHRSRQRRSRSQRVSAARVDGGAGPGGRAAASPVATDRGRRVLNRTAVARASPETPRREASALAQTLATKE